MTQNEIIAAMNAVTATFPDDKLPADIFQQERSVYNDRCRELCAQLRESQEQDVFEALFSYACLRHAPPDTSPDFAAQLLFTIRPACSMPCREAIWTVVTSEWDVSVEEIPWYFAYAFGTKAVYKVLEELEQIESVQKSREARKAWVTVQPLDQRHRGPAPLPGTEVILDAFRWWVDAFAARQETITTEWTPWWLK